MRCLLIFFVVLQCSEPPHVPLIVSLTQWNANVNWCYLMLSDVIRYEPHTLSLRPFKFFFQQLHWFLQLWSCFIKWYEKEWSIKLQPLCIHNGGCFETLNLINVSSCKMFTFCDDLHGTKQKNANKLSRVRSMD